MKRIVALVFVSACMSSAQKGEALMESVTTYNDGVRWERITAAASQIPPAERDDFVDTRDELAKNLKITDWEVLQVEHPTDGRATVEVKYTWYLDDEGIVHTTQTHQHWQRRAKAWLLVDEVFAHGDEMPGVEDPDTEAMAD